MAFPPTIPPATRTNSTPQSTTHPNDHNQISNALSDIVTEIQAINTRLAMLGANSFTSGQVPAQYANGMTWFYADTTVGYPVNGMLITWRNGTWVAQLMIPRNFAGGAGPQWRAGNVSTAVWEPWRAV